MHEPTVVHWEGTSQALAYIKLARGKGPVFYCHNYLHINAYSDGGYVGDKGD